MRFENFLLGFGVGMLAIVMIIPERDHKPEPMTLGRATTTAVRLTGRLMVCFGGCERKQCDYQCRPVELSQTEHPELRVRPVVACWDTQCELVAQ